jgi:hypothetical protein
MAAQLERRSRSIGALVDDAAIDRILEPIDLAGTTAFVAGIDAAKRDAATAAAIKRKRWGGEMRSMLSFLTTMVRRRELDTREARRKMARLAKALSEAMEVLRTDPGCEAAFVLAEMAFTRLRENMRDASSWTNERIAGEFLPLQYWTFTKRPKTTRTRLEHEKIVVGETVRFIQAVCMSWEFHTHGRASFAQCRMLKGRSGIDRLSNSRFNHRP